jgi:trimeric autotransporter adhesin
MNPFIPLKTMIRPFLVTLALACVALPPASRALLPPPPPDGGYPGFNTAEGDSALASLTTGTGNTATGFRALGSNTTGGANTATGESALLRNTTGSRNTANGEAALLSNTTGDSNTANGHDALISNTTGRFNTANGVFALLLNTTGERNTASGVNALTSNTIGSFNTATGVNALFSNTSMDLGPIGVVSGANNTANGYQALFGNTIGRDNTAVGSGALFHNSETAELSDQGNDNSAFGAGALSMNDSGSFNTAIGNGALAAGKGHVGDTAVGAQALQNLQKAVADLLAPDDNIALGFAAGFNLTKGARNIYIGSLGGASEEGDTIRIGNFQGATFIAGIREVTTGIADAMPVVIDSVGQLGTASSSERFKNEIKPMNKTSEAILALKPVTFHFKSDSKRTPQFGLIAEEVAKVNPDLVVRDREGEIYSVRYDAVNAMLLNEFLKEHRKVEEQQAAIAELKSTIAQQRKDSESTAAQQQKQIEALTAGLQRVSAQLEVSKLTPQTVLNNQ